VIRICNEECVKENGLEFVEKNLLKVVQLETEKEEQRDELRI